MSLSFSGGSALPSVGTPAYAAAASSAVSGNGSYNPTTGALSDESGKVIAQQPVIQTSTTQRASTASNVNLVGGLVGKVTTPAPAAPVAPAGKDATTPSPSGTQPAPTAPVPPATPTVPATPATPVTPSGATTPTTGPNGTTPIPTGASGFKYDAQGNKTWYDAQGNTIDTTSAPEASGAVTPGSSYMNDQIKILTDAGNQQIATLTTTLQSAMAYSDSITAANIGMLTSTMQSVVSSMKDSYGRLAASKDEANARTGLSRYASDQAAGVLTNIMTVEQEKIGNYVIKVSDQIQRAQGLLEQGNLKAFNDTATQIRAVQKGIATSVQTLMRAATDYQTAQSKAAATAQKGVAESITMAKNLAPSVAAQIADIKDPADRANIVKEIAAQYNIDPNVLDGYVQNATTAASDKAAGQARAQSASARAAAAAAAKNNKNAGGGQSGKFKYTGQDITDITSALQTGGTFNGTKYNGKGADGYVDPDLYQAQAGAWQNAGGKIADFIKQFPPKDYINPADNKNLPVYFRNTARTPAAANGTAAPS